MGRNRITDTSIYGSWDDVNNALREIGRLELQLTRMADDMTQQISGVKALAMAQAKPIQAQIAAIGKDVKAYATAHRDEMKGKTKQLAYGKTGFRQSTKIILPTDKTQLCAVIDALRARRMTDCIRTRETVDKDALRKYAPAVIADVGGKCRVEDEFWYDVDREKLPEFM